MKKLAAGLFMSLMVGGLNAQTLERGDNIINLGFGFDPYYSYSSAGGAKRNAVGPIVAGYEYIVTDKLGIGRIGVGGIIGQSFYNEKYTTIWAKYHYKTSRTAIVARAAYHFELPVEGLDLYAGVGGGFYINNQVSRVVAQGEVETKNKDVRVSGAHYIFGGARYFFTDAFGVYAEFGYGFNAINGGMVFKF